MTWDPGAGKEGLERAHLNVLPEQLGSVMVAITRGRRGKGRRFINEQIYEESQAKPGLCSTKNKQVIAGQ